MRTGSAQIAIWRIDSSNSVLREGSFSINTARPTKTQGENHKMECWSNGVVQDCIAGAVWHSR